MFREELPTEYRDWATSDHELYDAIAIGMHARGAMPEPDSREPWFLCEAHADADIIDRVLTAFARPLCVPQVVERTVTSRRPTGQRIDDRNEEAPTSGSSSSAWG